MPCFEILKEYGKSQVCLGYNFDLLFCCMFTEESVRRSSFDLLFCSLFTEESVRRFKHVERSGDLKLAENVALVNSIPHWQVVEKVSIR